MSCEQEIGGLETRVKMRGKHWLPGDRDIIAPLRDGRHVEDASAKTEGRNNIADASVMTRNCGFSCVEVKWRRQIGVLIFTSPLLPEAADPHIFPSEKYPADSCRDSRLDD